MIGYAPNMAVLHDGTFQSSDQWAASPFLFPQKDGFAASKPAAGQFLDPMACFRRAGGTAACRFLAHRKRSIENVTARCYYPCLCFKSRHNLRTLRVTYDTVST
jgi:hypothetical protein